LARNLGGKQRGRDKLGEAMNGSKLGMWLVGALMTAPSCVTAQTRPEMRCDFYKTVICMPTECFDGTGKDGPSWAIINWETNDYALCDRSGCQHERFTAKLGGVYYDLTFPGTELIFKLNVTDNTALELSSVLNAGVVSWGNCSKNERR
jgi:hypothetical protein